MATSNVQAQSRIVDVVARSELSISTNGISSLRAAWPDQVLIREARHASMTDFLTFIHLDVSKGD